jgi:valyl-tRNA synthetase
MENIKDWCISRQLWWGQRIPAYYLPKGGYVVAETAEEALALAQQKDASLTMADLRQDEDVLDTWFSSWLWPISVFDGIRNPNNPEIEYYYPTNDLVTGPDIIFFWVARMIMAGYEWRGMLPFKNVYFTGIVRDKLGRKMSKQLGNSPDPLDLIAKYGADGMRVAMLMSTSAGNDVMFDEALCEQGRNFGNKIWNAYRLVNMWAVDESLEQPQYAKEAITWFDEVMAERIERINHNMEQYRISEAFTELYRLFWDDFSGWYLEMVKPAYQSPADAATIARTKHYFDQLLRLLHPFMPFITEEIWQDLKPEADVKSIVIAQQPKAEREADAKIIARFGLAQEIVSAIRNVRKQKNIPQREALVLQYIADENFPEEFLATITKLGGIERVESVEEKNPTAAAFIVKTTQYFIPLEGNIDREAELKRLGADLEYLEGFLASVMKKLSNERFVSSAPEKVVANERAKQADAEAKIAAIKEQINALK